MIVFYIYLERTMHKYENDFDRKYDDVYTKSTMDSRTNL